MNWDRLNKSLMEMRSGLTEKISPEEALQKMTHTSERKFDGTIYTISDQRHPEYNGKKIKVSLVHGKNKVEWVD
jgi:hypothetical protein